MSMDEQFFHMTEFIKELEQFNQILHTSWRAVEQQHDQLEGHWQDEFRRNHDLVWESLDEKMQTYLTREGPHYLEFLGQKQVALERYLRGV